MPSLHEPFGDIPEANLFGRQLQTDADGNFELYVGGEARTSNWLPTTPGSRKLFIRPRFAPWHETPATLGIHRVGLNEPAALPTTPAIIDVFAWPGAFVTCPMQ